MISRRLALFLLLTLLSIRWATAQILDDSTKNVYGPTTTRYVLENDIFNNREIPYSIDTLIDGFHNYSFLNRNQNLYQDLGNFGTATRPVFYQPPDRIGAMLGYSIYSLYAFDPESIRYYNTRSPFTSLYYVQGGNGIQLLDVEHSQNIKPYWNVGFHYRRPTSQPQNVGFNNPNNRQVDNHTMAVYSRYVNKDSTYQIMGNFTHLNHRVNEEGSLVYRFQTGDQAGQLKPLDSLFSSIQTVENMLDAARSWERRNDWHVYQQYAPVNAFQLYYVFDRQKHLIRYVDEDLPRSMSFGYPGPFYPAVLHIPTRTAQDIRYLLIENKVGIKGTFTRGRLAGFNYRFQARRRDYSYLLQSAYNATKINRNENFLGGWLNYYFPDSSKFFVEAEYLIGADYRGRAEYQSKWLTAGYYRVASSPTMIQQSFTSNNFQWQNDYNLVSSDNIYGNIKARLGKLTLQPSVLITNLKNYVYFDTNAVSRQEGSNIQVLRLGFGFEFRAGNFHTINQAYYTTTSNAYLLRIPTVFVNSRLAYQVLFKKVLYIQLGTQLHYKSDYKADAYMPLTGQYHLQDDFSIPGYLIADVFADLRIKRVRLFFKLAHANQGLMSQPGYFAAPVFPGLRRSLGFGVNWLMFD